MAHSLVLLSFTLPIPMVALVLLTRRRNLMGEFANRRLTNILAIGGTMVILAAECRAAFADFGVPIPGPPAS
jgi:manganese transport protein